MAATILQRLYSLADAPSNGLHAALASAARKLASDDDAASKAHALAGIVKKLAPAEQERIVKALEGLRA